MYRRTTEGFLDLNGGMLTPSMLYERLQSDPRFERFIIQQRLRNHPDLIRLSGTDTLQTIRFVTWISGDSVEVLASQLRIVVGGNLVDNFGSGRTGNLIANVGWSDGLLADAMAVRDMEMKIISTHPTTGFRIRGFRLPHWQAARELVLRAARLFLPLRTIGWDVAIASDGPILMEGNAFWDPSNEMLTGPQVSPSPQIKLLRLMKQFKVGH